MSCQFKIITIRGFPKHSMAAKVLTFFRMCAIILFILVSFLIKVASAETPDCKYFTATPSNTEFISNEFTVDFNFKISSNQNDTCRVKFETLENYNFYTIYNNVSKEFSYLQRDFTIDNSLTLNCRSIFNNYGNYTINVHLNDRIFVFTFSIIEYCIDVQYSWNISPISSYTVVLTNICNAIPVIETIVEFRHLDCKSCAQFKDVKRLQFNSSQVKQFWHTTREYPVYLEVIGAKTYLYVTKKAPPQIVQKESTNVTIYNFTRTERNTPIELKRMCIVFINETFEFAVNNEAIINVYFENSNCRTYDLYASIFSEKSIIPIVSKIPITPNINQNITFTPTILGNHSIVFEGKSGILNIYSFIVKEKHAQAITILKSILLALVILTIYLNGFYIKKTKPDLKYALPCIVGSLNQFILMPILAIITVSIVDNIYFKLGLLIACICPGGLSSNIWTKLFNGDVNLSFAMTLVSSILCIPIIAVYIPFVIPMIINTTLGIPFIYIALLTFVPILLQLFGFLTKILLNYDVVKKYVGIMFKVSNLLKLILMITLVILQKDSFPTINSNIFIFLIPTACSGILIFILFCGLNVCWFKFDLTTILIECIMQNSSIAIVILQLGLTAPYNDIACIPTIIIDFASTVSLSIAWVIRYCLLKFNCECAILFEFCASKDVENVQQDERELKPLRQRRNSHRDENPYMVVFNPQS